MKFTKFALIFVALFALLISAPVSAQSGTSSSGTEDEQMYGYINYSTGDLLVVATGPMVEGVPLSMALSMMEVIVEDMDQSREISVDEDYEESCRAWRTKDDGETLYVVGCVDRKTMILAMGTDKDIAMDAAFETLDDGKPSTPRGYEVYEEN